jgi:hypothetical protein
VLKPGQQNDLAPVDKIDDGSSSKNSGFILRVILIAYKVIYGSVKPLLLWR